MLDAVMMLNLKTQEWRKWLGTGGLLAKEVPVEKIRYHHGPDAADYSGVTAVLEAAIADGLPKFKNPLDSGYHAYLNVAICAQFWSYMIICREAVENNETYLCIHDDHRLYYDYGYYERLVNYFEDQGDFGLCLLGHWKPPEPVLDMGLPTLESVNPPGDVGCIKGIAGPCDVGFIVSPVGAEWLVENASPGFSRNGQGWWTSFETYMWWQAAHTPHDIPGAYTMQKWTVGTLAKPTYIGSTIHDAEKSEKTGIWSVLRPSSAKGGHS